MGLAASKDFEREDLAEFRKLPRYIKSAHLEIPERAGIRKPTDRKFLISFILTVVALIPFMVYTLYYANVYRYFGCDECGNVCGQRNYKYDQWPCTGKDVTNKVLLQVDDVNGSYVDLNLAPRMCVAKCFPGYDEVSGYCLKRTYKSNGYPDPGYGWLSEIKEELKSVSGMIILACSVSLGIGLLILFLFRVATAALVWCILMGTITLVTILMGTLWRFYTLADKSYSINLLVLAVISTIVLFILLCIVIFFQKRISLVIALFREVMKATFAMPLLLTIQILVFFVELLVIIACVVSTVYMSSAGELTDAEGRYLVYRRNTAMIIAIVLNICVTVWTLQLVYSIEYMIIAAAISKWYFGRSKPRLGSPIKTSTLITFKYHLGSVALGSLVMVVGIIIRFILSVVFRERCGSTVERFPKFSSKQAYVMTAMHGQPLFKSGRRAVQIIVQNMVNVTSINSIGSFILFMAHLLVVALSLVVGYLIFLALGDVNTYFSFSSIAIVFIVSIIVAVISFSIFGIAIDTIFLCYCEDCILNDGMQRPYAMSTSLMQFMDSSKRVFPKK